MTATRMTAERRAFLWTTSPVTAEVFTELDAVLAERAAADLALRQGAAERERILAVVRPHDGETLDGAVERMAVELVQWKRATLGSDLFRALSAFAAHWHTIPPLVRASYANIVVNQTARFEATRHYDVQDEYQTELMLRMPRRARVHEQFRDAARVLRTLAIDLVRQADDEAEAAGIDADTGAKP